MALNYVTVTWNETDIANFAQGGYVSFAPSQNLTAPAEGQNFSTTPRPYLFNAGTGASDPLVATDNTDILQTGWTYVVTIAIRNQPPQIFNTFINFSNGASQKLSSLTPVVFGPTATAYALQGADRAATFTVAASNASAFWKANADYVCTGTNDHLKINAAMAALPPQGGTVLLSDGLFSKAGALIPTVSRTKLRGQGPDCTVIQDAVGANSNGYQFDVSQAVSLIFCSIEGVTFNGSYNNGSGNTSGYGCHINYNASFTFWDFYLRDVWFENYANDGFWSTGGHGYVLDHVLGEFNGGNGVNFTGGFTDTPPRIINGTYKLNGGNGIVCNVIDAYIAGNEISGNTGTYGLVLSQDGIKATGNQITHNTGTGVHVTNGTEGMQVFGNTISYNGQHGILIDVGNSSIVGNFLLSNSYVGNGGTTGAADEINVAHGTFSASGNVITGNSIDGQSSSRYGINFSVNTDTASVAIANRIVNCITGTVNAQADTIILDAQLGLVLPVGPNAGPMPWVPSDNGLIAATASMDAINTNPGALTAGTMYLVKLMTRAGFTATKIWYEVQGAGSGASTGSFVGLYSSAGTLLSGSADIGANLISANDYNTSLTTPQTLAPGGFVWVALLCNLATTQAQLACWGEHSFVMPNLGLTAATYRVTTNGTGLSSLPASITPSANVAGQSFNLWFGIS